MSARPGKGRSPSNPSTLSDESARWQFAVERVKSLTATRPAPFVGYLLEAIEHIPDRALIVQTAIKNYTRWAQAETAGLDSLNVLAQIVTKAGAQRASLPVQEAVAAACAFGLSPLEIAALAALAQHMPENAVAGETYPVKLGDVARELGVSPSTFSRMVTGSKTYRKRSRPSLFVRGLVFRAGRHIGITDPETWGKA